MEEEESQDKLLKFIRSNFLIFGLLSVGIVLVVIGLIQMTGAKEATVKFEKGETVAVAAVSSPTLIKVDVEGQVVSPGVYELKGDARVQDALIAAGGLSGNADRKALNLAQKIADGQKVYVPAIGEQVSASVLGSTTQNNTGSSGIISINSASESQLESLPGIGPVSAQKIINSRPYGSIEELLSKKAVGKATYDKIKDLVSL